MDYLKAFIVGGIICALVQILLEKTKMMPGRVMVTLVVSGAILGAIGLYEPFAKWAGAGATVPLLGFGNTLWKGVKEGIGEDGLLGESAGEIVEGRPGGSVGESIGNCGGSVRALPKVAGILDGPSDYITKALNTFDAPDVPIPADITTKVKGDQHCATVATAAVIAKVTRDRLMVDLAQSNPRYAAYEWAHNKGYGSAAHRAAIAEHGPTPLHRVSWHLT